MRYDVIISGSGIAGTSFGCILAKHGLKVLIVELGKHPRFALGEALLPQSAIWPFILGKTFGIPEIEHLSHADRIVDHITPQCGIKHSIGFAYHERGQAMQGDQCHQLIPPHLPFYSESHLMREDVDVYLLEAAQRYGCDYLDETRIEAVEIDGDGVRIATDGGAFEGAYYIDSSGKHSLLAQQAGYRTGPEDFATHSRTIFTHVEGLVPFDDLLDATDLPGQTKRLHDGTLHHVFDGGWMWVIPFDNFHRSASKRASVGLMLDPRKHPERPGLSPEQEFHAIISEFPSVAAHLAPVKPVFPFIRTGRLQYGANRSVGDRFFLTNNTYGFVDALYSNGLINTFESVFLGAKLLLDAFGRGGSAEDFSAERFEPINRLHRTQLQQADFMVSNAYRAMGSFPTWNAWTQLWLGQVLFHDLWLQRACFHFFKSGDAGAFDGFLSEDRPGSGAPFVPEKMALFARAEAALVRFEQGGCSGEEAAAEVLLALEEQEWLPKHVYGWGQTASRHVDFSLDANVGALLEWGFTASPEPLRTGLFDFELPPM